jgi:hypothetical protein
LTEFEGLADTAMPTIFPSKLKTWLAESGCIDFRYYQGCIGAKFGRTKSGTARGLFERLVPIKV